MADRPQQDKPQQERQSSAGSDTKEAAVDTAREAASATRAGAQAGAEALRRGAQAGEEASRQGAQAMARLGQTGSDAFARGSEFAAQTTRQGGEALVHGQCQMVEEAAERMQDLGRRMAQAVQATGEDVRLFMTLPSTSGSLQDLQQSMSGLVEGVVRTNLQATQELFRLANPSSFVQLQQRFVRDYLAALMQGTANLTRAAHRATSETLGPLQQQIEQRQRRAQQGDSDRNGQWQHRSQHAAHDDDRVSDVMERQVRVTSPDDSVQQAARLMREEDTGALPVGENDRLVGMVTDHDVTVRLVAEGRDPAQTKVRDVMTPNVPYVYEDEQVGHVAENMAEQQVRRIPVVNRDKRLVGVVSLGDLERNGDASSHGAARAGRSGARSGAQRSQTAAE